MELNHIVDKMFAMSENKINDDLVMERQKCSFDVQELTYLVDNGENNTKERVKIEKLVFDVKELRDEVPEEYLSYKERYENSIRKACLLFKVLKEHLLGDFSPSVLRPSYKYKAHLGVVKDVSPFVMHNSMFVPGIVNQASEEQCADWLFKSWNMQVIGSFAQTELGHGTFVRGLETTATYDLENEMFILNSPTLSSYKWWAGGQAHTANHCIVIAQLYTKGQCYGVHSFFVQIRDTDTHMPLPGIKVGEIGHKLGFQTADNGFLAFEQFRIPRKHMLMKNAQVLKDGTYIKSMNSKQSYGTIQARVTTVTDLAYEISRAATVAVRYSAVRHQSQPKPGQPEPQVLDYMTQQHKLFIGVATSHVFRIVGMWLWDTYSNIMNDIGKGNNDQLSELHALSCCFKAVCSRDASTRVEEFRLSCGGHGYMTSSNLPIISGIVTATITYEGEYTVLLLQTARFLMKTWKQVIGDNVITSTVSYLVDFFKNKSHQWSNTPAGLIKGLQAVAAGKTEAAYNALQAHENTGIDPDDAWNLVSLQLVNASEAHCRAIICEIAWLEVKRLSTTVSSNLAQVLQELVELYLIFWVLEKRGDLLVHSTMSREDLTFLQNRYEKLLTLIRPNAVGIVDGFDIRDEILNSTLGAYDGIVYERMMAEALKSPLNAEPVNRSFHEYLKPLMKECKPL